MAMTYNYKQRDKLEDFYMWNIPAKSPTCGLKTSISHQLMPTDEI